MKRSKFQTIIMLSLFLIGFFLWTNDTPAQTKPRIIVGGATPMVTVAHSIPLLAKYLGYIKDFDVEARGFKGSTMLCQQAAMGTIEIISAAQTPFIAGNVKQKLDLLAFYNFRPKATTYLAVLDESSIKSAKDLRKKQIGISDFATDAVLYMETLAKGEKFAENEMYTLIAVGIGTPMCEALRKGRVDALCLWDIEYAKAENEGLKLRYIHDPRQQNFPSGSMISTSKWVKEHPKIIEEFGLGLAKATVFGMSNPEAAVKIYWQMVPGSKPTGIPEDKALKETSHVLKSHLLNLDPKSQKLRWGEFSETALQGYIDLMYENQIIPERARAKDFFTNQFVDKFTQFNEEEVIKFAKEFKVK